MAAPVSAPRPSKSALFSVTPLHKARRGDPDLGQAAILGIAIKMNDALRLMKWQAAQEKIVD